MGWLAGGCYSVSYPCQGGCRLRICLGLLAAIAPSSLLRRYECTAGTDGGVLKLGTFWAGHTEGMDSFLALSTSPPGAVSGSSQQSAQQQRAARTSGPALWSSPSSECVVLPLSLPLPALLPVMHLHPDRQHNASGRWKPLRAVTLHRPRQTHRLGQNVGPCTVTVIGRHSNCLTHDHQSVHPHKCGQFTFPVWDPHGRGTPLRRTDASKLLLLLTLLCSILRSLVLRSLATSVYLVLSTGSCTICV